MNDATKAKIVYGFTDNQSRQTWSNYPAQQVPRKGVAVSDLNDFSKSAALGRGEDEDQRVGLRTDPDYPGRRRLGEPE